MPSVWPFVPEIGATETFQYNTEVLKSYTKEQRIRLRENPRLILGYTFFLDDEQYAYAKAIIKAENQVGTFKVPHWQEVVKLTTTVASSATTITLNKFDHRFDTSELILWKDWDDYVICTILSKTDTTITLTAPVGKTMVEPFVAPIFTMRALNGFETSVGAPNINYLSASFTSISYKNYVQPNDDIFEAPNLFDYYDIFSKYYPAYKDKLVIINPPFRLQNQSGSIIRPVELVDNGFGPIAVEPVFNNVEERFVMDFFYQGYEQRADTLGLLCQMYGRQMPFWLPTFAKDILLQTGTFSSNTLTVVALGATTDYIGKTIYIRMKDGTYQFNTVTNCVLSGGNYTLTLETTLSSPVSNTTVDYISFMRLSRFDTDTYQFTSGSATSGKVTLNSIEVPN